MADKNTIAAQNAVIKVIGLGGAGGNAVDYMIQEVIDGVEFLVANTDAQALKKINVPNVVQLGNEVTKGLGAGANPAVGQQAAQEDREKLREVLTGADMVFIAAGMGGGTGTGAAPVVAELAKEMGILTVAVVTRPFSFEGKARMGVADEGIRKLAETVDSLITIPNNKLLSVLGKSVSLLSAFKAANNVLYGAVQGIADLITRPGLINVDFADVRTVMSEMGMAMMGTAIARGEGRAVKAAEAAIASPLLEDIDLTGARGILVNITAGLDLSIGEFEEVGEAIKRFTSENATVVVGTVIDPDMRDEIKVTVVVTGLGRGHETPSIKSTAPSSRHHRMETGVDYQQLEKPAYLRHSETVSPNFVVRDASPVRESSSFSQDVDYLDIPAFLRKQEEKS
ncbi:MAG: cell division protein FtsZ [Gammaproteobacteria bacterium]|nr:cell division protein FtsZ [Gammaproteobacteria bacterium]MCD8542410.1 cell division protein FtsZ [Gammaproteobacteria bacterium]